MPSRKRRDGTFRDIAHPINRETREMMEQKILKAYEEAVGVSINGPRGLEDGSDLGYAGDKPFSDGSDDASDYGEKPEE
jgi:stage V sporulation protein G